MYFDRNELYSIQSNIDGERISLYDVASWKNGLAFKNIDFSNNGMPVIKIAELNNGISSSTAFTDKQYSDDVFLTKGDFVFSWSGNPYTSIDIFRYDLPDGWLNQHIFKVVPNEKIITKDYFFYLMKYIKPNFIKIATNKQTTGLGHVTLNDIKQINFKLPNINMQYRISKILFCIDKKIAINNTINNNLEQQAMAIFNKKFVNIKFIPNNWETSNLSTIAHYLNGLAMQKYRPQENEKGIPVLKIKELRQGFCDNQSDLCSPNIKSEYLISDGDVIFSWSGTLWLDLWCGGLCGLNQHLFKVTSSKYDKWFYYFWTKYHLNKFIAIAADKATTMGHIKREDLDKSEVLIPDNETYTQLNSLLSPILELIVKNKVENRYLTQLRDTLLPKLMSGEIDVSNVDISADKLSFNGCLFIIILYFPTMPHLHHIIKTI